MPLAGTALLFVVPGPLGVGLGFAALLMLAVLLARQLWATPAEADERAPEVALT